MPHVDAHQPGAFSWVELSTTDPAAAKAFYEPLLGWTDNEFPAGPDGGTYTIFQKNGRDAAAGYALSAEMKQHGVPPNWLPYVTVEDADAAAKQASALGATVTAGPFDVMEHGRMAVIRDPHGAMLALWQPKSNPGMRIIAEPGAFAWAELMTPDAAASTAFYTKLFGWKAAPMPIPGGGEYTVVQVGDAPVGGIFQIPPGNPVPPNWGIYFEVADADATIAAATKTGASVLMPATDMEGVGRFAALKDPQGAAFSIIKSATR